MKNLMVEVEEGTLQGVHGWDPRIAVFKGVPYAAPPVGALRFRAPQPALKWEGVKVADHYGPMACQGVPGSNPEEFWTREIHPTGTEFEMSEDCLYLNVFTEARTGDEKMPVLIYIHGGGFQGGYSYEVEFDWEHMARKGIVVVSIGYRLGMFGFMAHPWLTEEAPGEPRANYGTQDQLAAIKWVKKNIAAFGGDPEKITIAGQSAGAMSVQNLMTIEGTDELISGAIIESSVMMQFAEKEKRKFTGEWEENLGMDFCNKAGIHSLQELRAADPMKLLALEAEIYGPGIHFQPVVDDILIKETNFESYIHNHHANVPVIAGFNRGEAAGFSRAFSKLPTTLEELHEYAKGFGEKAAEFEALCGAQTDEDVDRLCEHDSMMDIVAGTRMFGRISEEQGRRAYLYEFDVDIPGEDHAGSYHGSEMWFAYDSLARCWRPFTGKHYDMARKISSYWVNFIKTGDPNGVDTIGEELPEWKSYGKENEFVMRFTDDCRNSEFSEDELMKFRMAYAMEKGAQE